MTQEVTAGCVYEIIYLFVKLQYRIATLAFIAQFYC